VSARDAMRGLAVLLLASRLAAADPLAWPALTRDSRPWTRWWWLGSAVDEKGLTRELEQLSAAGFGGVEVCPIYGVVGEEERAVPFLSPRFVALVAHASAEARRLGMAVDLTTGTGWPFGGPTVGGEDAAPSSCARCGSRAARASIPMRSGPVGGSWRSSRWPRRRASGST
jgi:hypothetical protein